MFSFAHSSSLPVLHQYYLATAALCFLIFCFFALAWKQGRFVKRLQLLREVYCKWCLQFWCGTSTYELTKMVSEQYPGAPWFPLYEYIDKVVVIRDVDLAKKVLDDYETFSRPVCLRLFTDIFQLENVFTTTFRPYHDDLRKIMAVSVKGNNDSRLKNTIKAVNVIVDDLVSKGTTLDLVSFVDQLAIRTFAWVYLGITEFPEAATVTSCVRKLWRYKNKLEQYWFYRNPIIDHRIRKLQNELFSALDVVMKNNKQSLHENENFLKLMEAANGRQDHVSDRKRNNLLNILIPGYETMARIIIAMSTEVMNNEKVASLLTADAQQLCQDPSMTNLSNCSYLNAVWRETLRLHPPVPNIYRKLEHDTEYFCSGTIVAIAVQMIQRNPEMWPSADQFLPERFLDANQNMIRKNLVPFGIGNSGCVARDYAGVIGKMIVAVLFSRFKMVLEGNTPSMNSGDHRGPAGEVRIRLMDRQVM